MSTTIRAVVMGTGAVGKSAVTISLCQKKFVEEYDPTIEDSYRKNLVVDESVYELDLLDTAGQEEYSAMRDAYMSEGEAFALVYAVNSRDSFESLVEFADLISRLRDCDVKRVPLVLIANKTDLPEEDWQVCEREGTAFASRIGATYVATSAKTGANVELAFATLIRRVVVMRNAELKNETSERKKKMRNACSIL
jgi:GTPase KRas protein